MEISSNLRIGDHTVPAHRAPATPPAARGPERSAVGGVKAEQARPAAISKPETDKPVARGIGDVRREVAHIAKQVRDLAKDVERAAPERVRDQRNADRVRDLPLPTGSQPAPTEPTSAEVVVDTPLPVKDSPLEQGINGYSAAELREFADQTLDLLKYIHSVLNPAPERIENPVAASASFTQAAPNAVEGATAPRASETPQAPTNATPTRSEFQEFAASTLATLNEIKTAVTNLPRPTAAPQSNNGRQQPLVLTLGKQGSISQTLSQSNAATGGDQVGPRLKQLGQNIVSLLTMIQEQVKPSAQSVGGSHATTASITRGGGVNLLT